MPTTAVSSRADRARDRQARRLVARADRALRTVEAAQRRYRTATLPLVAETIRDLYPTAAAIVVDYPYRDDEGVHMHLQTVEDGAGLVLGSLGCTGERDDHRFEELADDVDVDLDAIAEHGYIPDRDTDRPCGRIRLPRPHRNRARRLLASLHWAQTNADPTNDHPAVSGQI